MSITAPIPIPQSGVDAFMQGASTAQGVFESMVNAKRRAQQIQQASALFPSQLSKSEAEARLSQLTSNRFGAVNNILQGATGQPNVTNTGGQQPPQDQNAMMTSMTPNMQPGDSQTVSADDLQTANPYMRQAASANANQQQGAPENNAPPESPLAPTGGMGMSPLGAGLLKLQAQTPEEKAQTEVNVGKKKTMNEVSIKQAAQIQQQARAILDGAQYGVNLQGLLEKRPDLTGLKNGLLSKSHLSEDSDLARFKTDAGGLQTMISHDASARGGIGALQWAQGIKPDVLNQPKFNKGMIDQYISDSESRFRRMNEQYKKLTGEELPFRFEDVKSNVPRNSVQEGGMVRIQAPDGKIYKVPEEGAKRLLSEHADHKVIG